MTGVAMPSNISVKMCKQVLTETINAFSNASKRDKKKTLSKFNLVLSTELIT